MLKETLKEPSRKLWNTSKIRTTKGVRCFQELEQEGVRCFSGLDVGQVQGSWLWMSIVKKEKASAWENSESRAAMFCFA